MTHWRKEGEKAKDALSELALKGSELEHQKQSLAERLQREYATALSEAKAEGEIAPQTEEDGVQVFTGAMQLLSMAKTKGQVIYEVGLFSEDVSL